MDSASHDRVEDIRGRIAQKVGSQRFNLWFKNSTQFNVVEDHLEVGVPNPFIGGWIERHFSDQIAEAAKEATGRELQILYSVNPSLISGLRGRQSDEQASAAVRLVGPERRTGCPGDSRATPRILKGRLDSFVVGSSNRLAFNAALAVVEGSNARYGPLFIHGGCGLGKTHLLQGIANALAAKNPNLRWEYLSGEEFTNRFLGALHNRQLDQLRQRLRHLDALIIDDVHFLANKKATQEEFLHTFNAIDSVGKQVVMASDSHPKLIGQLSVSLISRFMSGMVVKIESPDFETRCEILRRRAAQARREVPKAVIEYIAENLESNVRELEGAFLKLTAFAHVVGQPITMALAKQALAEHISRAAPVVRLADIENAVAAFFGLSPADLHTSRKARTIALARAIAMFLARKHTDMSFPEIGRFMGNKNHSTVVHACRRLGRILQEGGAVCWSTPAGKSESSLKTLLETLDKQLVR